MLKKKWILPLFTLGLVILTFVVFKSVLSYILISAVLALVTRPLYTKLKRLHIGKFRISPALSALTSIAGFYSIIFVLIMIFIPAVAQEAKIITQIDSDEALRAIQEPLQNVEFALNKFTDQPISLQDYFTKKVNSLINISAISS